MNNEPFCRPLFCARQWVGHVVLPGDAAIDATVGNGHDSVFLARLIGREGRLDVFDIQQSALDSTKKRLEEHGCLHEGVRLHLKSHAEMRDAAPEQVKAVMFNLGYLPGGDKKIISTTQETQRALQQAIDLLRPGGILTVVCYPGHEGGAEEADMVERFLSLLPHTHWQVTKVKSINALHQTSPFLIAALKLR